MGTAIVGLAIGAFTLGRSWASGVPASGALTYSGSLQRPDGSAVTDEPISIKFWRADGANTPLCVADNQASVRWEGERFSVQLPDQCANAVRDNPDILLEVLVGQAQESLGRAKLGAVPFALEAARASEAAGALESRIAALETRGTTDAVGTLESRIAALETALEVERGSVSAFKAVKRDLQLISGADAVEAVVFEDERFDLADEFDPEQSVFIAKRDGVYYVGCTVYYQTDVAPAPGVTSAWYSVLLRREPVSATFEELGRDGFFSDGVSAYRSVNTTLRLRAGEGVSCWANYQIINGANPQYIGGNSNGTSTFEAYRITGLEAGAE